MIFHKVDITIITMYFNITRFCIDSLFSKWLQAEFNYLHAMCNNGLILNIIQFFRIIELVSYVVSYNIVYY